MVKFSDKEVVLDESFLIADNEEVQIDKTVDGVPLRIRIRFVENDQTHRNAVEWSFEPDNTIRFTFYGWIVSVGTATGPATHIGTLNNKPLGFAAYQTKIGILNFGHIFLLLGGAYAAQ